MRAIYGFFKKKPKKENVASDVGGFVDGAVSEVGDFVADVGGVVEDLF